jgi:enoyl-CoA hydratase
VAEAREFVRATVAEGVALVALQDASGIPRLSREVLAALAKTLSELARRADVHAFVLTGTTKCFAAGAEVSEVNALTGPAAREFSELGQSLMNRIERSARPVVAAVRGHCLGGGFDLALACHLRVAADDAIFGHPGGSLGLVTGWGGTARLPRIVGRARAMEILATGRAVTAEEARCWRLVNRVVSAENVLTAAHELANAAGGEAPPRHRGKAGDESGRW